MIEIIPTNTCPPDFAEMAKRSGFFAQFAEWVQLDISDGAFTSIRSWPYGEGQWAELERMAAGALELPSAPPLRYETHLMVEEPRELGMRLAEAGIVRIIGHVEAFPMKKKYSPRLIRGAARVLRKWALRCFSTRRSPSFCR